MANTRNRLPGTGDHQEQGGRERTFANETLMSVEDLCDYLQLGKSAIYNLAANGGLPHIKIARKLRFQREAVVEWLSELRVPRDNGGSTWQ